MQEYHWIRFLSKTIHVKKVTNYTKKLDIMVDKDAFEEIIENAP